MDNEHRAKKIRPPDLIIEAVRGKQHATIGVAWRTSSGDYVGELQTSAEWRRAESCRIYLRLRRDW